MAPQRLVSQRTPVTFRAKANALLKNLLFDTDSILLIGFFIMHFEFILNKFIISKVKYTEIDWVAYMQEVEGYLNGTADYMKLRGDTGPLVYPAGFVYLFSMLYHITSKGTDIVFAQHLFILFYVINLFLVFRIYKKTAKCPPYVLIFMSLTSYRLHSIFVLRLFNDPIAMLVLFASVNFYLDKRWLWGSVFFSLAVSIKMNVMLFAPGLLVLMLYEKGLVKTVSYLFVCAVIQVGLAIPFLKANAAGYLMRAFDFGRKFDFKWTVNWRFLSEDLFLDSKFHILLLVLHLAVLLCFASQKWRRSVKSLFSLVNFGDIWNGKGQLTANQIVTVLFTSNFIGIAFSRSLHYQFYSWYYHTIPYLLWTIGWSPQINLTILGVIEMCWNTYPSTDISSATLHACHVAILFGLWTSKSAMEHLSSSKSTTLKKNN